MLVLSQNILEKPTAGTQNNFMTLHMPIVICNKSNISEILVINQVSYYFCGQLFKLIITNVKSFAVHVPCLITILLTDQKQDWLNTKYGVNSTFAGLI